jgi:RNA polymerase sigma-70 factor (ECF subfamily)
MVGQGEWTIQPLYDPAAQDDGALVARALRDPNAYGAIVLRFEAVLKRYVRRLLGRHAQSAEDVLQDAFLKAYVNLNDYDPSRPLAPWLYRIAHNEAVSFLRKHGAQPRIVDGEDGRIILERLRDETAADATVRFDFAESGIHDALAGLDPRYRDVLVLRYLEDKSYDEISDILEMPPGTVATRIRRGLERLKSSLPASPGNEGMKNRHA